MRRRGLAGALALLGCCFAHIVAPAAALCTSSGRVLHCASTACRARPPRAQVQQQEKTTPMPFVLSTSDAASRSASTEEEYRLSESADATMAQNYGEENAFSTAAYDMVTKFSQNVVNARTIDGIPDGELKDRQVSTALNKMRRDVISLDALASSRSPQLRPLPPRRPQLTLCRPTARYDRAKSGRSTPFHAGWWSCLCWLQLRLTPTPTQPNSDPNPA